MRPSSVALGQDFLGDPWSEPDSTSTSDTVWIDSVVSHSGQQLVLEATFSNQDSLNGIDLPLTYTYSDLIIDSVSFQGSRAGILDLLVGADIDSVNATVHIYALNFSGISLGPGRGRLARIFVTVPPEYPSGLIPFDSVFIPPASNLKMVTRSNNSFVPQFRRGSITNTYAPALNDSVWVDSAVVTPGHSFSVVAHGYNERPLSGIKIPLRFFSDNITFDSASIAGTRCAEAVVSDVLSDNGAKKVLLTYGFSDANLLPVGSGPLIVLHFTCQASGSSTQVDLDTTIFYSIDFHFQLGSAYNRVKSYPRFIPGKVRVGSTTDVSDGDTPALPRELNLAQNQPNPFNPSTTISFSLPARADVSLEVFNVLGQKIRTLAEGGFEAGVHTVVFDGRDDRGRELATAMYFYRLKTGAEVRTRKMMLIK